MLGWYPVRVTQLRSKSYGSPGTMKLKSAFFFGSSTHPEWIEGAEAKLFSLQRRT